MSHRIFASHHALVKEFAPQRNSQKSSAIRIQTITSNTIDTFKCTSSSTSFVIASYLTPEEKSASYKSEPIA